MVKMFIFVFLTFVAFVTADYYDHAAQMRQKTIERFAVYIQRLNTTSLSNDIRKCLKNLSDIPLNIAVTGGSGVGKSTLINTFRGLSASDFSAAAVGVIETTHKIIKYEDPKYSQFVYWDLPGCGTPDYPRNTYLSKVKFDTYDFFLIVSAERFTENDRWLADEIQKQNKQFFMIRNKINIDLQNEKRDHPKRNSTEVLNEIRTDCVKYLTHDTKQQKVPIYLISALLSDSTNWDFPNLVNDSIRQSLRLKQELLINQLTMFSQNQIKQKANLMRSRVTQTTLLAAFLAAIPLPSITLISNIILLERESNIFKTELFLDEEWLISLLRSKPSHFNIIDHHLLTKNNIAYYKNVFFGYITIYLMGKLLEFGIPHFYEQKSSHSGGIISRSLLCILYVAFSYYIIGNELSSIINSFENSALDLIERFKNV